MDIVILRVLPDLCSEEGGYGVGYELSRILDEKMISRFAKFGHLVFLRSLKVPFFVLRSDDIFLKGTLGASRFRIGIPSNDIKKAESIAFNVVQSD